MSSFRMGLGCSRNVILYWPLVTGRRETFVPTMMVDEICVVSARAANALAPVM